MDDQATEAIAEIKQETGLTLKFHEVDVGRGASSAHYLCYVDPLVACNLNMNAFSRLRRSTGKVVSRSNRSICGVVEFLLRELSASSCITS